MDSGDRRGVGKPYPPGPSRVSEQIHWEINSRMNDRLSTKGAHQSIMADITEENDNVGQDYDPLGLIVSLGKNTQR